MSPPVIATTGTTPKRAHIAMCAFPFFTHPTTLLHLGRKIAATVPDVQVTLLSTWVYGMYLYRYIPEEEWEKVVVLPIDDGLEEGHHPPFEETIRRFMEVAGKSIRAGMAWAEAEAGTKITCLVSDGFLTDVCREIAEEKGLKWVVMWTSSAAALAAHMYADELRRKIGVEGIEAHRDETVDKYIPGFPSIPIYDLPVEVLDADLSTVAELLNQLPLNLPKAAAVAVNSFDHLESPIMANLNAAFGIKFLSSGLYVQTLPFPTIGGEDICGCLPWLDIHLNAQNSVIYVSYGTNHASAMESYTQPLVEEEIKALAEGLEASGVPFLWSLNTWHLTKLPEGFMERAIESGKGKFTTWTPPHMLILNHKAVGAQFTDCGWDSVTDSIAAGVPMICRASRIADHMLNRRLVESVWGMGTTVEGGKLTKSTVARTVERVMLGKEGRRMREKVGVMKKHAQEAADGSSAQNLNKFISFITG